MKAIVFYCIALVLILFSSSNIVTKTDSWPEGKFIEFRVDQGRFQMLRLIEEGLICRSIDSNFNKIVKFIPLENLNINLVMEFQTFLISEFFKNDTIIDDQFYKVNTYYANTKFMIGCGQETYTVTWIDGNCQILKDCLRRINIILPHDLYDDYSIQRKE